MKIAIKDRFNDLLSTNLTLNFASDLNERAKKLQKGNTFNLLRNLLIGSYATMLLSFAASVFGFGNSGNYLMITMITNLIGVFINNLVFVSFLKCIDNEKLNGEDTSYFLKKFPIQIACALLLTVCQSLINIIVLQATMVIPTLNVIASILMSLIFTFINAIVAFQICDHKNNVRDLIKDAFTIFVQNWKSLLFLSMLFIVWSYGFSIAFTNLLYGQLQQQQGINNIFHSLLSQHDYINFGKVNLFYLINYLIAGYLEIRIFLALALSYRDNNLSNKKKRI